MNLLVKESERSSLDTVVIVEQWQYSIEGKNTLWIIFLLCKRQKRFCPDPHRCYNELVFFGVNFIVSKRDFVSLCIPYQALFQI